MLSYIFLNILRLENKDNNCVLKLEKFLYVLNKFIKFNLKDARDIFRDENLIDDGR